ncbi:hypothetical protein OIDMADRAFT_104854 [Oidiodendron maius Zn]|uniref:Ribonuclease H n=1 Tax=Oidiodendron maius (strain Zn) TaxID=913774 RepID=A0A0C3CIT2_OIDMZ|nr:hypothetical protein OIDMADRAFT_104854 [Oidiodendron maius Zn]
MSSASKKRKFGDVVAPTKYYAVRAGHKPGVYSNWAECQANITGFKGASCKISGTPSKPLGDKFYGVAVGRVPGVYEDWAVAAEQIKDVKGPKYKKFSTREEAEEFVRTGGKSSGTLASQPTKKVKTSQSSSTDRTVHVYTDGSSRGNGKKGALAGVGVYFGDGDSRNVSEALKGEAQTNQRAELTAIQRALEIVPRDRDIHIYTDSNYSINCSTVWYVNWKKNNWTTAQHEPVMNKDLILAIRALIDERDAKGSKTHMEWVKGHDKNPGNEAADKLAVTGSMARRS